MMCKYSRVVFTAILLLIFLPVYCGAASNIDPDNDGSRYAFAENVGWINLAPAGEDGVTVAPSALTGKAWGENVGWINFSPANGGVVNDGMGHLSGYAWGENVGWINFAPTGEGVVIDPVTGLFSGRAWGENVGWISFASAGAAPFRIKTLPESVTGPLNGLCGSANGDVFMSVPSASILCSVGTASAFAGYGPWSWDCDGLNGGVGVSCSASVQNWNLIVNKSGSGMGTVTSAIPHPEMNCGSICTRAYNVNSIVTLTASPSTGSRFTGWSGCDTVNGRQCTVIMSGIRNVEAEFSADIKVVASFHDTIQAGYNIIAAGNVMKLRETEFSGDLLFNRSVSFTLRGGYDAAFSTVTNMSTIHGSLTIAAGTVELDRIVIANSPPLPGNDGVIYTSGISASGVSLQFNPGSSAAPGDELSYRVYYSDTDTLATVADIEAYGTPVGEFIPATIGRVSGKINRALNFSGTDYVDAGNGAGLNFGTGSFSVEAWIKPASWNHCAGIIGKGASQAIEPGYTLRQLVSGADNYFQFVMGNGVQQVGAGQKGYVTGLWYHLVGVADRTNNTIKLYVNGSLVSNANIDSFSGSTDSNLNLSLGKQFQSSISQDRFFNGIIDETAVYNRALSVAEIADRYNAGVGKSVEAVGGLAAGWDFDEENGATVADISGAGNAGVAHFSSVINLSGLAPLSSYSVNVIAMDNNGNKSAYKAVTMKTTIQPIAFDGSVIGSFYTPAVGDFNNDGFIEALGTLNDGNGNLTVKSANSMGLGKLFSPGRVHRDCRSADFNSDNLPDLICNTYSAAELYTNPSQLCQDSKSSYSANSVAMLFFNNGNGTFREDTAFTARQIMGFGETILAADFNNDGFLDIYLPYYSHCSVDEHSILMLNDGTGDFTEISDTAGVSLRNRSVYLRVEGAQAVDFNLDGWLDIFVGGHMFINNGVKNGVLTFTDQRAALGLPDVFEEGIKFLDWNNDGYLDLVIHHPSTGPALYQFNGSNFSRVSVLPSNSYTESYGMNIFDMNNDGREDIITSGGPTSSSPTYMYLNNGAGFERNTSTVIDAWGQDLISFADIDNDGKPDLLKRLLSGAGGARGLAYFKNTTAASGNNSFNIELVGASGEKNQQGRVIKIYPQKHPGVVFTRIVDSGSGYMTQSSYEILVGTPYSEPHRVEAFFRDGVVSFMINPGEKKRIYPDGTTLNY